VFPIEQPLQLLWNSTRLLAECGVGGFVHGMGYDWMGNGAIGASAFNRMNSNVVGAVAFGWINMNEIANRSMGTMELLIISLH
jgi:hypothetical protein